jgi:hypothetical protein
MTKQCYIKPEPVWSLPDWAPKDAGDILYRDGNWIFVKDYKTETREPMASAIHLCNGEEWVPHYGPSTLIDGECNRCHAKPPEAFEGFFSLLRWKR